MAIALETLSDDPRELKEIILAQQEQITQLTAAERVYEALIQALKLRIAKLRKQMFGPSSEKIEREIEQLRLALEDLEVAQAGAPPSPEPAPTEAESAKQPTRNRRRGNFKLAEDTPRERVVLDPGEACPDCGGQLRLLGEDVSAVLDFIAAKLKFVETARLKKSCRVCEKIVQPPAPTRPIHRGMAGPNLLAHILVSKFDDHIPLYRQGEILARHGAEVPRSTLIDWCGQAVAALRPLSELIKREVMKTDRLHADDTPIKVLDPRRRSASARGVKEGRIWVYVRDDRPWAGRDPPGAAYWFSPDRKGDHPQEHLAGFEGILQADAYAGFKALYKPDISGKVRVREAACWAHLRRDFHDIWKATGSSIAREALEQIGALYDIEREIIGKPAEQRLIVRQTESRSRVDAFRAWCEKQLTRVSRKGELAKAIRYALNRWTSFTLFLEDGRVAIDNNPAERALRGIALGRKNFLFAGSDAGGETLADAMTIIESAKLSSINPEAYLSDVLARINDHIITRLDELLPWNWKPLTVTEDKAAA